MRYLVVPIGIVILSSCSPRENERGNWLYCFRSRTVETCIDSVRRRIEIESCFAGVDSVMVFPYPVDREVIHAFTGLWFDNVSYIGAPVIVYYNDRTTGLEYNVLGVSGVVENELQFLNADQVDDEATSRPIALRRNSTIFGVLLEEDETGYYRLWVR